MMKSSYRKLLLAVLLLCVVPTAFAKPKDDKCNPKRDRRCEQVPEGGSAAIYLLCAGITCVGAIVIRSRSLATTQA
jgi:hypothetical protein